MCVVASAAVQYLGKFIGVCIIALITAWQQWHSKGRGGRHLPKGGTLTINKKFRPVVFKLFLCHGPPDYVLTTHNSPKPKNQAIIHAYNSYVS